MEEYFSTIRSVLERIERTQSDAIEEAAGLCATAIAEDHVVHLFGAGHSRMIVEEVWPRYGSFPGFHPIVELSVTAYHQVSGSNGMRQAMFLENVPGLAAQIVRNFAVSELDALIAISAGGTSVVTVEVAEVMKSFGIPVIAITSVEHCRAAQPKAPSGLRLFEVADIVLDTCTPIGDAAVSLPGLEAPVGPTTTVAGATIANALKVRVAEILLEKGLKPEVLPSALVVGKEASARAFEDAFDEHARLIARLYER
jgi:uncharacterized phosphosugar-binding protein